MAGKSFQLPITKFFGAHRSITISSLAPPPPKRQKVADPIVDDELPPQPPPAAKKNNSNHTAKRNGPAATNAKPAFDKSLTMAAFPGKAALSSPEKARRGPSTPPKDPAPEPGESRLRRSNTLILASDDEEETIGASPTDLSAFSSAATSRADLDESAPPSSPPKVSTAVAAPAKKKLLFAGDSDEEVDVDEAKDAEEAKEAKEEFKHPSASMPALQSKKRKRNSGDSEEDIDFDDSMEADDDSAQQEEEEDEAVVKDGPDRSKSLLKRSRNFKKVGVTLEIRHGDITAEHVGAVVNAANTALAHGGGVAGAISRSGGPEVQRMSDVWVRRHGTVKTGQVAVTGPGRLPSKYIIHAVGPIYTNGRHREHEELYSAVMNSLRRADELRLSSISIPAISSGIFGFPKEECARVMFDVVEDFVTEDRDGVPFALQVIRFCNFDKPTVSVFMEEFDTRYGAPE